MLIYLASQYTNRQACFDKAKQLIDAGHLISSAWITAALDRNQEKMAKRITESEESHTTWKGNVIEEAKRKAWQDMEDISNSDLFIFWNKTPESSHGGCAFEFGYALALGKPTLFIGTPSSIFHWQAGHICRDWAELKAATGNFMIENLWGLPFANLILGTKPTASTTLRPVSNKSILQEATEAVANRMEVYGHPKDNFGLASDMMSAYLGRPFSIDDYIAFHQITKLARLHAGYHRGSVVDQAGYARTQEIIHEKGNSRQ